jgi:hypothetical protein
MYRCLSCGVVVNDFDTDVETVILKLIDADVISRVDIVWEHQEVCHNCKIYILRQIADNLEAGKYVLDKDDEEITIQ